jgi:hypothetical protein
MINSNNESEHLSISFSDFGNEGLMVDVIDRMGDGYKSGIPHNFHKFQV